MKKSNLKWLRHEALDRTHVIRDQLHDYLINHQYAESGVNPEFKEKLAIAFDALCDAYQICNKENEK